MEQSGEKTTRSRWKKLSAPGTWQPDCLESEVIDRALVLESRVTSVWSYLRIRRLHSNPKIRSDLRNRCVNVASEIHFTVDNMIIVTGSQTQWCARGVARLRGPIVEKRVLKCPLVWQNTLNCPLGWLSMINCPLGWQKPLLKCPLGSKTVH